MNIDQMLQALGGAPVPQPAKRRPRRDASVTVRVDRAEVAARMAATGSDDRTWNTCSIGTHDVSSDDQNQMEPLERVLLDAVTEIRHGLRPCDGIISADGERLWHMDVAFNFYDMELGLCDLGTPTWEGEDAWIDFGSGEPHTSRWKCLNGERICSVRHAIDAGWITTDDVQAFVVATDAERRA